MMRQALHIVDSLRSVLLIVWLLTSFASARAATDTALLFSFFRDNGQDGLLLAWSTNGLSWTELKPPGRSFLEPTVGGKLMRDPCLARAKDGTFHMVWTTSWNRPPAFGYARSTNLLNWTSPQSIPVMDNEPTVENVWAPELFFDDAASQWLIFWASTIPGKFPETANSGDHNHRIYYTSTKDFGAFTPTKLFYDGGFNVIDATMFSRNGKHFLVVKDETKNPVKKNLRLVEAESATGPFKAAGEPFTTSWVEGPSVIEIGGEVYVYFDHYSRPQYYGAMKSADLKTWQDISSQVSFPKGARHGTVLRVPQQVIRDIQAANKQL